MKLSTLGIDLAKNVFQLHGVDHNGKTVLKKKLTRKQFVPYLAQLEPCLIGMEACSSSHHFARLLTGYGHQVKLIPPQYVKPYVKTNKTDAADAEAICEAVTRPNMRFVAVKTVDQQAILALHTERELLMRHRTAHGNSIRAMLAEFGLIMPVGFASLYKELPEIMEDAENGLSMLVRHSIVRLLGILKILEEQIKQIENEIIGWSKTQPACQRLLDIPGVGLLTATSLVASVGNARQFSNAKQFVAWLGLCPREHSSGGKQRPGSISKRGNAYFRCLLVHGARSVVYYNRNKPGASGWLTRLLSRKPVNMAVVAQAAKTARIMWSMLYHGTEYCPPAMT